jgi:hypothetical protein
MSGRLGKAEKKCSSQLSLRQYIGASNLLFKQVMEGEPQKNPQNHHWLKNHPANLIRLAHWRRRVISANTIGFREVEALQKVCTALPICQDIAY